MRAKVPFIRANRTSVGFIFFGQDQTRSACRDLDFDFRQGTKTLKRAGEGIRTLNSQLGRLELYQLSYSRRSDEAGTSSQVYVNGVIKPANDTSVGFYEKPSLQNASFYRPETE